MSPSTSKIENYPNLILFLDAIPLPGVIIGTDEFDRFMKDNNLWDDALKAEKDQEIVKLFLTSRLSMDLILKIESFLKDCKYPIAVRSSSLLEDSQYQPLSGAYSTFMLANNQKAFKDRIHEIKKAIRLVFASIFYHESKLVLISDIS